MGKCASCGNEYDSTFKIEMNGQTQEFDSFECAVHLLAPQCTHCGTRVIGHGFQDGDTVFCSAHCARQEGRRDFQDRSA
jgi:DNA-directed RNA polymerase subunit RPC12/RpoP